MKNYIAFLLLFSLFFSCKKTAVTDKQLVNDNIFGFNSMEEAKKHLGNYADIFRNTEGSIEIKSTLYNNISEKEQSISGRFKDVETNEFRDNIDELSINDISLNYNESFQNYSAEIDNLFGKDLKFHLKDGDFVIDKKMYMPKELDVKVELGLFPESNVSALNKKDNLTIEWNKDENNKNGVIAYLYWDGSTVGIRNGREGEMHRAIMFEDDGSEILSKSFFEGLPVNADFTIFFMRGNIDIYEINDTEVKFYSVLESKHNFVLVE